MFLSMFEHSGDESSEAWVFLLFFFTLFSW